MRVSVKKDDPGYREDAWRFHVLLDGKQLDCCFTADEDLGEAWVWEKGADGLLVVKDNQPVVKRLTGEVKLIGG
jgi:hypothetical protein